MSIAQENLQPPIVPVWSTIAMPDETVFGVVELPVDSPSKPHKAKRGSAWVTFIRVGSTSREPTRDEEARLYQAARIVRYEIKAVPDTSPNSLDMDRIANYYRDIRKRRAPASVDLDGWRRLLLNSDLLVVAKDRVCASVAGLLLFGENPNRRLPQAGVTAVAFPGIEKDYNTIDEERIRGPLTPRVSRRATAVARQGPAPRQWTAMASQVSRRGVTVDKGVIDRTIDFVRRNMGSTAWLDGGRRRRKMAFPLDAVRGAVVNAVVHRDYTREGTDIEVSLYADRLEVISPGRLPNGVTVAKMREGVVRVARNELLKEILRDYGYIEHYGMGVRNRIIESMQHHNCTEPDLVEEDHRFVVRLWKAPRQT